MKDTKQCSLLVHHLDTVEVIRKAYDLDKPGRLDESIDRLHDWIQAQPHFNKKDFDRGILEMILINNKGSVEKAKQKIEKHCAIKTYGKRFFNANVRPIDLEDLENLYLAVLPKLTKDNYRIYIARNTMTYYGPKTTNSFGAHTIFILETLLKYNYSFGMEMIFDWRKTDLKKLLPLVLYEDMHHLLEIFLKGYQMRIKNVHILTTSKLIGSLIGAVKSVVSPKVLNRVVIHKNLESLYKLVDKDLLPSDYGGKEKTLIELAGDWNKYLSYDDTVAYISETFEATIDTTKKPKAEFNDLFFGMAGTFRTLQID